MRCATGYSGRVNKTCTWKEDTNTWDCLTKNSPKLATEENITLGRVNILFWINACDVAFCMRGLNILGRGFPSSSYNSVYIYIQFYIILIDPLHPRAMAGCLCGRTHAFWLHHGATLSASWPGSSTMHVRPELSCCTKDGTVPGAQPWPAFNVPGTMSPIVHQLPSWTSVEFVDWIQTAYGLKGYGNSTVQVGFFGFG